MTFSINTNNSSMAALESLRTTANQLASTENAVSTGLSVSSAADNPAIYAIAQQMNGNISGLSAVSSSLSFGAQVVSTASSASQNIISTLQTLQATVTSAGTGGLSLSTLQTQVANALNDINTFARNSTFNGVNLLTSTADAGGSASSNSLSIVDSLQGNTLSLGNQAVATKAGATVLTDALGLTTGSAAGSTVVASGTAKAGQTVQTILNSSGGGVNISLGSGLAAASFSDASNVILTNADGSTTTFEFDKSGTKATAADTSGANANHTVVVTVANTTETSNQMIGDLVNAMNANGYSAAVQSDGSVSVVGQGITAASSNVSGLGGGGTGGTAAADGAVTNLSSTDAAITSVQSAITKMTAVAATLGNTTTQITGLQTFTQDLSDSMTSGVGALTDADLSAESAKLTSLQTKQQLAIQSLSIANSQSQSILSLFR